MKSILIGNGVDIQFGGKAYTNRFIMSRIILNARTNKYASLFDQQISGEEIATLFKAFLPYANNILKGKYDNLSDADLSAAIHDFKCRFSCWDHFENYYEIPLEDWFMLMQIFYVENPDLASQMTSSKQGIERMVLDAIYNDGKIQTIHKNMGKRVRKYFQSFDNIFTLNYDDNIEELCGRNVYHLHGDYAVLADSENPQTLQGFYRKTTCQTVIEPGFEHCFCNALLHYSGEKKYKQADSNRVYKQFVNQLQELKNKGNQEYKILLERIRRQFPEPAEWIDLCFEHPELLICSDYHFAELRSLGGELHIVGLSPQNDSHVFRCIEESGIDKVVFYHYGDAPTSLPITKEVEYKSVSELWKGLGAENPHYNFNPRIPDTDAVQKFINALNALSFDPITREEMIKELKGIPAFIGDPLCIEALQLMEEYKQAGPIKDADEQMRQFLSVSKIALREGIYPSAFYMMLINYMNTHKTN